MDACTLQELAAMCKGKLLQGDPQCLISCFSQDTRKLHPGDVYIALRGERFDGNQFLDKAAACGAAAAIAENLSHVPINPKFAVVLVPNALEALQHLAESWRDKIIPKVVCITGSNGKTTTKELTATVLATRYSVASTSGNFNNHIGLPLSILATSSAHSAAVWEIGMSHRGDIRRLAQLARPQIGVITNIGVAHIGNMGSREAIADEKGTIAHHIAVDGTLILSAEDDFSKKMASSSPRRALFVGLHYGAITASNIEVLANGSRFVVNGFGKSASVRLSVPGKHIVKDALFAIAVGLELGVPISDGAIALSQASLINCHPQLHIKHSIQFIDDSYNANPDSVVAAISTLSEMPCQGRRLAVIGRMDELGIFSKAGYHQVAHAVATSPVHTLITVGEETLPLIEEAKKIGMRHVHHIPNTATTATFLNKVTLPGDLVLVKGSHSACMGSIIEQF